MTWYEWAIVMFIAGIVGTFMGIFMLTVYAIKHAEKFGPIIMRNMQAMMIKKVRNANH